MMQCSVLCCPGEKNQQIFPNDEVTLDSCYFQTYSRYITGEDDFMKIEIGSSNYSSNR
jgi:hypothetical protein